MCCGVPPCECLRHINDNNVPSGCGHGIMTVVLRCGPAIQSWHSQPGSSTLHSLGNSALYLCRLCVATVVSVSALDTININGSKWWQRGCLRQTFHWLLLPTLLCQSILVLLVTLEGTGPWRGPTRRKKCPSVLRWDQLITTVVTRPVTLVTICQTRHLLATPHFLLAANTILCPIHPSDLRHTGGVSSVVCTRQ